jgi:hypothetical protein
MRKARDHRQRVRLIEIRNNRRHTQCAQCNALCGIARHRVQAVTPAQ